MTGRLGQAKKAYGESLDIVKRQSTAPLADQAATLDNLGSVYSNSSDPEELAQAQCLIEEALETYRHLAITNPAAFRPRVAITLNNLGLVYHREKMSVSAGAAYEEALTIYRELSSSKPAAYLPMVALALNALGNFYWDDFPDPRRAESSFEEALTIFCRLSEADRAPYLPNWAMVLENLALFYLERGDLNAARKRSEEALEIRRQLWRTDPSARSGDELGRTLNTEIDVLIQSKSDCSLIVTLAEEAKHVSSTEAVRQGAQKREDGCTRQ